MANQELIDNLNRALSLELAAVIQYMQHSFLVTGVEREVYRSFFHKQSEESHGHATTLGDKIVALGGVPTVEPSMIRRQRLTEMRSDMAIEREGWGIQAAGNPARTETADTLLLEERISEEQLHIEELEKLTSERKASITREKITLRQVS